MRKMTTGEMIDQLRVGDVATNDSGEVVAYDETGILVTWNACETTACLREAKPFEITELGTGKDLWTVEPKFVSFKEAQEAFVEEGKSIIFHQHPELQYKFVPGEADHFQQLANDSLELKELIKGDWIILNRDRKL